MNFIKILVTAFPAATLAAITVAGCAANTGIVKISEDTYLLAWQARWLGIIGVCRKSRAIQGSKSVLHNHGEKIYASVGSI